MSISTEKYMNKDKADRVEFIENELNEKDGHAPNDGQQSTHDSGGVKEKIEFGKAPYVRENPNPKNDIYQPYVGRDWDILNILKAVLSSVVLIVIIAGSPTKYELFVGGGAGLFFIWKSVIYFYKKYPYRKKVIQNGTPYPGIVSWQYDYETGQKRFGGGVLSTWSSIDIAYYDKIPEATATGYKLAQAHLGCVSIKDLPRSPSEHLENPYCTVYVWKRKKVAADFKVRDEYISKDGTFNPDLPSKE